MKLLETQINFAGHSLCQIWRKNDVAVYARSLKPDAQPHELELIFVQIKPDKTWADGRVTPEHEAFPSSSEWGSKGFSFPIRYKDLVLALAEDCSRVLEGRATLVKQRRASWVK